MCIRDRTWYVSFRYIDWTGKKTQKLKMCIRDSAYTDHLKKGITGETAIRESLAAAAEFASKVCGMNGAFGLSLIHI